MSDKDIKFRTGRVLVGSCLDRLKELPDDSIDSIVTDPPYELGFMGKKWDASGVAYNVELWAECLRVLKPGGHLLAFGGTRTYHRMTVAIEDAGFEIRDSIHWVYGSGFPKSHNVSKALEAQAKTGSSSPKAQRKAAMGDDYEPTPLAGTPGYGVTGNFANKDTGSSEMEITNKAAKKWEGWGTALKPAHEPIVLARKPLEGTVAANVKEHGTGAINIDGCRIETDDRFGGGAKGTSGFVDGYEHDGWTPGNASGRWPANIIFDEAAGAELDAQSGIEASRFFYCPKPGKKERNAGLDELPAKLKPYGNREEVPEAGDRPGSVNDKFTTTPRQNFHPTVKPVALMRYLVRLVTPPGGTVLDPFLGSGTTAVAAIEEGFKWIGCEMTADYLPIISGRVKHAEKDDK